MIPFKTGPVWSRSFRFTKVKDRPSSSPSSKSKPVIPVRLLRSAKAAEYLCISTWQLRNLLHDGHLAYVTGKFFRFEITELDRYIRENTERRQPR